MKKSINQDDETVDQEIELDDDTSNEERSCERSDKIIITDPKWLLILGMGD